MRRRSVTRLQVSGHRFLTRRMEYALVCRDTRMLDDPIRGQNLALSAGGVLCAIAIVVCAVLALLRPQGVLGDDPIVVVRESGALYVRIGDTVHPVLNLASARLIARTPAQPRLVGAATIAGAKTGPMMGIPGAPTAVDPVLDSGDAAWTVCDDGADRTTTLSIGGPDERQSVPPMLVTPRGPGAGRAYLLRDGHRAEVDLRDRATVTALGIEGVDPLSVSDALLQNLPEDARILTGRAVPAEDVPVGADFAGALCTRWQWTGPGQAPETTVFTVKTIAGEGKSVKLAQSDGAGPRIDAVSIPAGRSIYAHAAGIAGDGQAAGPRYLVTGAGVAFGITDDDAADALGLPPTVGAAPWPVLALLPRGPELGIARATLARDSLASP